MLEDVKCTCSKKAVFKVVEGKTVTEYEPIPKIEMTVPFDFGDNLKDAVEKHTEAQVFALYKAKGVIAVQDAVRRWLSTGKSPEEILNTLMPQFKFGATIRTPVDPKQSARAALQAMSPEERKAFLADLARAAKEMG